MKNFKGKAIYNPSGKAGEYSYWACNFYTGCSNNCEYCYCKKGVMAHTWSDKPKLKACFKDEHHALQVFEKELMQNLSDLQKYGLFFSFTTDPILPETKYLTYQSLGISVNNEVPVKILTKRADFVSPLLLLNDKRKLSEYAKYVAFGFTLTGHDELELNASTNSERIEAMKKLHDAGFKTWASIEPIVDFESSLQMFISTSEYTDLYKIGLQSEKKYDKDKIILFMQSIHSASHFRRFSGKIYFKNSLLEQAGINREDLPANCVGRDYNLFKN